jgi:hypothetical protein
MAPHVKQVPFPYECSEIELPTSVPRWTPAHEVKVLCWLASQVDGDILEIGCNEGMTTRDLALHNPTKTVLAVDCCNTDDNVCSQQKWERPALESLGRHARELANVRLSHIKSTDIDYRRPEFATVRFIFIDGDHSYAGVKADSERALQHLERVGEGIIVWHDCYEGAPEWVGVQRYLETELVPSRSIERIDGTWLATFRLGGTFKTSSSRWGLCMAGNEHVFTQSILRLITPGQKFNYLEIGAAEGHTLMAVSQLLASACGTHWSACGIDIPGGWSLNETDLRARMVPYEKNVTLVLESSSSYLARMPHLSLDFAFVDGCHGKACVKSDFIALTRHIKPGGVICFHDTPERVQGLHFQPHCQTGIAVRSALKELGLFDNEIRGWRFLGETEGDRLRGGHGMALFQSVGFSEPKPGSGLELRLPGFSVPDGLSWFDRLRQAPFFRKYSQYGEDGILDIIFGHIGTTGRFCVDIGAHDGLSESNTRLLIEQGWTGLLMDKEPASSEVVREFISVENINEVLAKYAVPKEFDFLNLDIDGNEYWIWQALEWTPRVVCVEFNESIQPAIRQVIKYDPGFVWRGDDYYGASFAALQALGQTRGYTLITVCGGNMIFVRKDILKTSFEPPLSYRVVSHFPHSPSGEWVSV